MTPFLILVVASFAAFILVLGAYSVRTLIDDAQAGRASAAKRGANPGAQGLAE